MDELTPTRVADLADDLHELLGNDVGDLRDTLAHTEALPDTFRTLATRLQALATSLDCGSTPAPAEPPPTATPVAAPRPCTALSVVCALEELCAECNLRFAKAAERRHHRSNDSAPCCIDEQCRCFPAVEEESRRQQNAEREAFEAFEKLIRAHRAEPTLATSASAAPTNPATPPVSPAAGKRKRGKQENAANEWYRALGEEKRRYAESCALASVERRLYALHTLPLCTEDDAPAAAPPSTTPALASDCPPALKDAVAASVRSFQERKYALVAHAIGSLLALRVLAIDDAAVEGVLARAAAPEQGRPAPAPRAQTFVATKQLCVNGTDGALPPPTRRDTNAAVPHNGSGDSLK